MSSERQPRRENLQRKKGETQKERTQRKSRRGAKSERV